jgi:four helix bundle protein
MSGKAQITKHKAQDGVFCGSSIDGGLAWPDAPAVDGCVLREDAEDGSRPPYDLEARTAIYGEQIVRLCKRIPRHPTNDRINGQLAGAGTSLGANYVEATERLSRKDFRAIISRCAKETKETRFFLRMLAAAEPNLAADCRTLYAEASELLLIFGSMYQK